MTVIRPVGIRGTGSFLPERVLTNEDLQQMVDTSDEWITTRTGIKERRLVSEGETTSDMAMAASRAALESAGLAATDLDMIIVATVTGDLPLPATACLLQHRLGAREIGCFDLQAACAGYMYGLNVARGMVATGQADNILVIGVESLSKITDYQDRGSCILFGDGAGAAIVSSRFERGEILSGSLGTDGEKADVITILSGGSLRPASHETIDRREHYMRLRGREVYKFAVSKFVQLVREAQELHPDLELGYVIPHQVNLRIIESARERLGLEKDQVLVNIERTGNTSAASIGIGMDEARRAGALDRFQGKLLVMCAFGAGLTWGSVALKW
ncbi:MAG: beta-ketoacyl-ACP synthase III [Planctomycetota bacterium]